MYCNRLYAWWSTQSLLTTLLSSLIACPDALGVCRAHVGFLLLRYTVLFTVESFSLLYLVVIS